jgi:streptogramin lyase
MRVDPKSLNVDVIDDVGRFGLATTRKVVWVTDFESGVVSRLDPSTKGLIPVIKLLGNPNALAILGTNIWIGQHRGGSVARIDGSTGRLVAEVDVGPAGNSGPHGVAVTASAIWVGITNIHSVVRVDPATNQVVATIVTKTSPCGGIAAQSDAVWVSSCFDDHYAVRIDPRSNTNVAEIDLGGPNGGAIMVDGYPWFPVGNRLVRIDPATNRVDRIVQFTSSEFDSFGSTTGFGALWIGAIGGQIAKIPMGSLR